jgi:type II secretory pathway pseudopilin PulG
MRRSLHDESGFTVVELVIVTTVTIVIMAGVSNAFVSGLRASSTTNSTLASQTSVHLALDRLEFESRCAQTATLLSGGAGVYLAIPSNCPHATGTVSWCVTSGSLVRYPTSDCSGTGQTFAHDVTSATPFSCIATLGDYPQLQVALTVNSGTTAATAVSATDQITLRNAQYTTSTVVDCQ